jgi:hypothetical protein
MPNGRGRPQLYCRPSHRIRAYEKRREIETRQPSEKLFRTLKEQLEALRHWRIRSNKVPGMDEMRRAVSMSRTKAYQQAVERVRESLTQVAPEVLQDLVQSWRATLSDIEATREVEGVEAAAVGWVRPHKPARRQR